MRQSMPVLVILTREALDVVFACLNWALLWPLGLVRQYMGLEVLESPSAFGVGTLLLLLGPVSANCLFNGVV